MPDAPLDPTGLPPADQGGNIDPPAGEAGAALRPAPVEESTPPQAPVGKPSLTDIGYTLARYVLGLIAGVIVLSASLIGCGEHRRLTLIERALEAASPLINEGAGTTEVLPQPSPDDSLMIDDSLVTNAPPSEEVLVQLERTAETLTRMVTALQEERDGFREFTRGLVDLALLNVLLPVLTALLGYIFGTRAGGTSG